MNKCQLCNKEVYRNVFANLHIHCEKKITEEYFELLKVVRQDKIVKGKIDAKWKGLSLR
jgi:hypothetical protein